MNIVIGHKKPDTDSICSAIAYAELKKKVGEKATPARCGPINPETEFVLDKFNIEKPRKITELSEEKVILVDHNEYSQAAEGLKEAEILEVIDHHRIGGLVTSKPIYFHCEPVGSTATIIADHYKQKNIEIPGDIAGILLSAILSDTVVHRSPTNTDKDEEIAEELAEICEVDIEKYGKKMLKEKSKLGEKQPREIILGDFKEYEFAGEVVGVGQVETVIPQEVISQKTELMQEMEKITRERNYKTLILLVTDLLEKDTEALVTGETKEFEEALQTEVENGTAFLKGVLSRKKQVIPPLEEKMA
ncbi:manganese-dependent inorganic pyrophosphatase [Methanonatronarchaeum sp. AMET6-2]|uniref:manganese-dependent inorganic pyrophosphatase n=1 Tax=Methanonatronarchaeum sp. AMET6-2 TaxID=2933293 RepID=UPI001204143C|nr:manganese-dependent inorganic pyrophosphatase [Methanonatronarchaeum sp. AMET6-2]RZN60303.1 MAG: manganese-dependent inorganic pyrophosphatase [Methanonatronarchaeia archaeon]UOY10550.1 manganese-dependent inorganic pyrophosphatase [Methanonatronarchaeum sp. AMET6-2]